MPYVVIIEGRAWSSSKKVTAIGPIQFAERAHEVQQAARQAGLAAEVHVVHSSSTAEAFINTLSANAVRVNAADPVS
jgi:hypothetical protein